MSSSSGSSSKSSSSGGSSKSSSSKKTTVKKKDNGSSKYAKKTSTPKASTPVVDKGMDRREAAYVKPAAPKKVAPKKKITYGSNSTAKTTAAPAANIKKVIKTPVAVAKKPAAPAPAVTIKKPVAKAPALSIAPSSEPAGHPSANKKAVIEDKPKVAPAVEAAPVAKKATPKGGAPHVLTSTRVMDSTGDLPKKVEEPSTSKATAIIAAPKPIADKGMDSREAAAIKPAAPKPVAPVADAVLGKAPSTCCANRDAYVAPKPVVDKGMDSREAAAIKPAAPVIKSKATPKGGKSFSETTSVADPVARNIDLLKKFQEQSNKTPNGIDTAKYDEIAKSQKGGGLIDAISPSLGGVIKDKYRNDDTSYNQAYWAARKESGASQADMAKEQQALGMKKSYSGDRVVTDEDIDRGKYILDSLMKSGITPEVSEEKKGMFGETTVSTSKYDIGTGKPLVITEESTSPTVGGVRLGDDKSVTYVDGVAVWTGKGQDGSESEATAGKAALSDQAKIEPIDKLNTVTDIQDAIENTTDKEELAALHKRLRALMRSGKTRTRFSGLRLGEADVESTKLGTRI